MNARVEPTYAEWVASHTKNVVDSLRKVFCNTLSRPIGLAGEDRKAAIEDAIELLIDYHETNHDARAVRDALQKELDDVRRALDHTIATRSKLYDSLVQVNNENFDQEQRIGALKLAVTNQRNIIVELEKADALLAAKFAIEQSWRRIAAEQLRAQHQVVAEKNERIDILRDECNRLTKQVQTTARIAALSTDVLLKELTDEPETTS